MIMRMVKRFQPLQFTVTGIILLLIVSSSDAESVATLMAKGSIQSPPISNSSDCAAATQRCEATIDCRKALSDYKFYCDIPMDKKDLPACVHCSQLSRALKDLPAGLDYLNCDCMGNETCRVTMLRAKLCPRSGARVKRADTEDVEDDNDIESYQKCRDAVQKCQVRCSVYERSDRGSLHHVHGSSHEWIPSKRCQR